MLISQSQWRLGKAMKTQIAEIINTKIASPEAALDTF
jgi:hypothetical protein